MALRRPFHKELRVSKSHFFNVLLLRIFFSTFFEPFGNVSKVGLVSLLQKYGFVVVVGWYSWLLEYFFQSKAIFLRSC